MLHWAGTIFILIGTYLLTKKLRVAWLVSGIGSMIFIISFALSGDGALVLLNTVFVILSLHGWLTWND